MGSLLEAIAADDELRFTFSRGSTVSRRTSGSTSLAPALPARASCDGVRLDAERPPGLETLPHDVLCAVMQKVDLAEHPRAFGALSVGSPALRAAVRAEGFDEAARVVNDVRGLDRLDSELRAGTYVLALGQIRALRLPEQRRDAYRTLAYRLPRLPAERRLSRLWRTIEGVEQTLPVSLRADPLAVLAYAAGDCPENGGRELDAVVAAVRALPTGERPVPLAEAAKSIVGLRPDDRAARYDAIAVESAQLPEPRRAEVRAALHTSGTYLTHEERRERDLLTHYGVGTLAMTVRSSSSGSARSVTRR